VTAPPQVLLLSNRSAGSSEGEALDAVIDVLERSSSVIRLDPTADDVTDNDVEQAAKGASLVLVAGGDGSLHHAINALAALLDDIVLGLVPMGTGNDFARTVGLPDDPAEAAEIALHGREIQIDVGRARGGVVDRLFINACMGGFPVQANESISEDTKKRFGSLAFLIGGVKAATDIQRATVTIDGVAVPDCVATGVGNGRTCGGGIEVWPDADPSDGLLDACALAAENLPEALRLALKVKKADHGDLDETHGTRARSLRIEAEPEIEFNIDGELLGLRTPATFEIVGTVGFKVPQL
jgi:diacylglycerol kinase (ATP)